MTETRLTVTVSEYGSFVGLKSERVQVRKGKETVEEAPLFQIERVLVMGRGISVSTDLIMECAERGIPLHVLTSLGKPAAMLMSGSLTGTVKTRREQLLAFADTRGVKLAKAFARGKCQNQANLLKYMAKYRKTRAPELYREVRDAAIEIEALADQIDRLEGETVDLIRPSLMNREGRAAQTYWEAIGKLMLSEVVWVGREHRGTDDIVNKAINYGYGILYTRVEQALVLAGLDPYGGFVHVDRPGKPSLVLDAIEEFRQPIVDRTLFGLLNKGMELKVDEEGWLTAETRRMLADKMNARMDGTEPYEGKKRSLRAILASQAAHIATFVRGERTVYEPFVARW